MINIFNLQKAFFQAGNTKSINFRLKSLNKLKNEIIKNENEIYKALKKDLNKSTFEAYQSEFAIVLSELNLAIKNLKKWSKPKKVKTPLFLYRAKSFIYPSPYGVTLIISPWNYPFQLALCPLIGSIAAGNCSFLKLSEFSVNTSNLIKKILENCFDENYIKVFNGDSNEASQLLNLKFDYIFFTGSTKIGKLIAKKAAENLIPTTLELGGKSPCIVDNTADINISSKRIAWGKTLNSGQTCVAPDYLLIHEDVKDEFVKNFKLHIKNFFGDKPINNENYPKIINDNNFNRLINLIKGEKILLGGEYDSKLCKIEPTLVEILDINSNLMKDEIFGPILPIITIKNVSEAIEIINKYPSPLALYIFASDKKVENIFLEKLNYGGCCINDTILHITSKFLPFGGVGESGYGNYHGKYSFDTFSHKKSVLKRSFLPDISLRFFPEENKLPKLKKYLK